MRRSRGTVVALIGAQFGSEGKGSVAKYLASDFDVHVRVGAPNAGHTIWHGGLEWKMRSVPCGWVNPEAQLVIGAGALIDEAELIHEVKQIEAQGYSIRDRLVIDPKASVILPGHRSWEGGTDGKAHREIGSTGEGVGICRIAKISRGVLVNVAYQSVADRTPLQVRGFEIADTVALLHGLRDRGAHILLEGAQGSGLSLTHGEWPYCTSSDTNAAQLLSDTGIPPSMLDDVLLVARTYPIRVAGNSGPLPGELTWDEVGVPEERTTVTKKVRRVGEFEPEQLRKAMALNGTRLLALMFADYVFPELKDAGDWDAAVRGTGGEIVSWVDKFERDHFCDVLYLGTGPETVVETGGMSRRWALVKAEAHV